MTMQFIQHIDHLISKDTDFRKARQRIKRAMKDLPKSVTLADALKQQEKFNKCKRIPPDYESGER